jgi:thioredoxin 2
MDSLVVVCPHCDAPNRVPRNRLRGGGKCGKCHQALFEGAPVTLDDPARFAKHAETSDIPLLVDFSANWCAPCHALAPIFREAAAALEPDVRLVSVDVDKVPNLASAYAIRSVPTLAVIHHGKELGRLSGAVPLHQLIAWTRQHVTTPVSASGE